MEKTPTKLIEEWFQEHDGDGEFVLNVGAHPYSIINPARSVGAIVFTTKPTVISAAIQKHRGFQDFGMVGRYGLPTHSEIEWIGNLLGEHSLLFLGDMDPVDLMIFAWLRANLHPRGIAHYGVNDAYLNEFHPFPTEAIRILCTPSEQESLILLDKVFPDLCETVGPRCDHILRKGYKIELDAFIAGLLTQ